MQTSEKTVLSLKSDIDNLQPVAKTLFIPLIARYLESSRENSIISDPYSETVLKNIYGDLSELNISWSSQLGVAIRTKIIDREVMNLIQKFPDAIIINLGCGLDTRFQRMNNNKITWYDLDLPDVISLKKKIFQNMGNYILIAKSITDFTWIDDVSRNKHVIIIAEGLLSYFSRKDAETIILNLNSHFPGADFFFQTMSPFVSLSRMKRRDIKFTGVSHKWGIYSGKILEKLNPKIKFINEWYYSDYSQQRLPFLLRIISWIPLVRKAMKVVHLRFK